MENIRCAPRFCGYSVGRCTVLSSFCSVPVVIARDSPVLRLFVFPLVSKVETQILWLSVFDCDGQCINTLVLHAKCCCRGFAGHWADFLPTLLGVVGVVVYCDTFLLLATPTEHSVLSVIIRQLGSSVFWLSYQGAVFVIYAYLGISWYPRLCTLIILLSVWLKRVVDVINCTAPPVYTLKCSSAVRWSSWCIPTFQSVHRMCTCVSLPHPPPSRCTVCPLSSYCIDYVAV